MLYNALSMGKKTHKTAPYPSDCGIPLEEDRATAIGNMHKKLIKIVHVVWEICSQTETQTDKQTCSSQYFATTPVSEVIIDTAAIKL